MREWTDISVEKAIIHMVSPDGAGLQTSDRDIPLGRTRQFRGFLAEHVLNGLRDSQTRTARFTDPRDGIGRLCEDIILHGAGLVPRSKRIAGALQGAIGTDKRITPGALVVALCTSQSLPFLALLKLDPGEVFTPEWQHSKTGRYLAPKAMDNALPTVQQRLQKCAFMNPAARPNDRERLLVLDRQVHDVPANFFLTGFLHAEPEYGPAQQTEDFHQALMRARGKLEGALSPRQLLRLDATINGVLAQDHVNINEWLSSLPSTQRATITEEIERKQLDREITLDQEILVQKYSKVRFECDNGVTIQGDKLAIAATVKTIALPEVEGRPRLRIIIDTTKWAKREG